jgi:hypothetical protein
MQTGNPYLLVPCSHPTIAVWSWSTLSRDWKRAIYTIWAPFCGESGERKCSGSLVWSCTSDQIQWKWAKSARGIKELFIWQAIKESFITPWDFTHKNWVKTHLSDQQFEFDGVGLCLSQNYILFNSLAHVSLTRTLGYCSVRKPLIHIFL